jgi:AcrR family transcriptional regulator
MTPYRYFGDKEGILAAVRARGVARLADQLEAAVLQGPAAAIQTYICFAMEETAYYRLIFDLSQPPALAELTRQERRIRSAMAAAVAAGRTDSEGEILTHSLWAALHGAICLVVAGKLSEPELGDLASRLALMVLGINQRFTVPPLQASPLHDVHASFASGAPHMAATRVAAE